MNEIIINTSYDNYDGIRYYNYEYLLQTPVEEVLNDLLKELDSSILIKDIQVLPVSSWKYSDIINNYIRFLFRIPIYDYVLYNHYVDLLYKKHQENIEFEEYFKSLKESNTINNTKTKSKTTNKKKVLNKFIRTETHNLFTGELEYDYTNFATGESFISSNPNLLEELNAPKKKKEVKKASKKEFGKIILNFKMK